MTTQKSIRGSHIGKPRICVRLCACPRELFNIQSTHWSSRPRYVSDEKKSINSQSAFPTQSSVCILYLVCILHPVCSLQSAVCILYWPDWSAHKNKKLSGKFQNRSKFGYYYSILNYLLLCGSFVKWCFVSAENDNTWFRGQVLKNLAQKLAILKLSACRNYKPAISLSATFVGFVF